MANQKLENLLNLALETPEAVREKSLNLNVGFAPKERTWEVIVKYNGSLSSLEDMGVGVEELLAGYAILTVPENMIEQMAELPQIEYVEKPKRLFFEEKCGEAWKTSVRGCTGESARESVRGELVAAQQPGMEASCILPVTRREPYLTGAGTIVAVIDSGIDAFNRHFQKADGSTRILYLWDQTLTPGSLQPVPLQGGQPPFREVGEAGQGQPPEGFHLGVEFTEADINRALQVQTPAEQYRLLPSRDVSGHGTAVAGIAAARAVSGYEGVAPESSLIIVKLGLPDVRSFPRTTELMRAVTYVVRKAQELSMPIAVNLSFGNTYGAHDGTSLLERFLDNAAEIGRTVICVGSGNEGASAGHVQGNVSGNAEIANGSQGFTRAEYLYSGGMRQQQTNADATAYVELAVSGYETALNVQLWKNYVDSFALTLRSPGGEEAVLPVAGSGKLTARLEQTDILIYMGEPTPYAVTQEVYFDFIPVGTYLTAGVWSFKLQSIKSVTGQFYFYLPSGSVRGSGTRFFAPSPQVTLTIPSTAQKVITVGAYDTEYDAYADFSGRGYIYPQRTVGLVAAGAVKPDLTAPGVSIRAPDTYGGYGLFTGTSFATPFVTGSAVLLMEWGIVRGNDRFLYGEKVKAYFRNGARPIRGEAYYPNERVGYGALCVAESLPL